MPPRQREDFAKYTKNGTIKITIGAAAPPSKNQIFHIYRDLLTAISPYFAAKLQPHGPNGNAANNHAMFVDQEIIDDEDDVLTALNEPDLPLAPFTQFVNWLYNKPLNTLVKDHALTTETYLLAHKLETESFRNDIVDAVRLNHASNPDEQLGLRSMHKLAKAMNPDLDENDGKCRLLEFLVAQMTYKVIVRGWGEGGFQGNGLVKKLFKESSTVLMWHLDLLHEILGSQGFTGAVQALERGKVKVEDGGDEMMDVKPGGPKTKRPALSLPANPAEFVGCKWHEHKLRESRCGMAMMID